MNVSPFRRPRESAGPGRAVRRACKTVMAGLDPAIYVRPVPLVLARGVDARHEAGHDELWACRDIHRIADIRSPDGAALPRE